MGTENQTIGFIGAGNMAEAMIGAFIDNQLFGPEDITVSDIDKQRLDHLNTAYGVRTATDNAEVIRSSSIVVFAVKPQQIPKVLDELSRGRAFRSQNGRKRFVSIAAGFLIETMEKFIYSDTGENDRKQMPIMRVMPNTPALVGAGMCALCGNAYTTAEDIQSLKSILSATGKVLVCEETKMDAVTAMSGSGPAYCFYMIESMIEAGKHLGLTEAEAEELTVATFSGALKLLEARDETAGELRRKVTSPGGTTEAALQTLDARKWPSALIEAIAAAAKRSRQLSGAA